MPLQYMTIRKKIKPEKNFKWHDNRRWTWYL